MHKHITLGANLEITHGLAVTAIVLVQLSLPKLNCFVKVFGIVWLAGLSHVLLDSQVEDGDEEVEI